MSLEILRQAGPLLTNELIKKKFENTFELTIYAIRLARKQIQEGKEVTLASIMKELYALESIA